MHEGGRYNGMKLALIFMVLLAACGGPATADDAPVGAPSDTVSFQSSATTTTIAMTPTVHAGAESTAPEPPVATIDLEATGPDAELIHFESQWLCEAQRQTFDSPEAVDVALDSSLGETGISRSVYDTFKSGLSENPAARKQILDLFVGNCS